jgi:D-beta-D-heptose 7-phosphate kinase/D-beta-D-heptose 1-phosphate adenosyltransferase
MGRTIKEIIGRFGKKRILVVGDMILDHYVFGTADRISQEAPVPIVHVTKELSIPGGAANVAMNIKDLGGEATACGAVGEDHEGNQIRSRLNERDIFTYQTLITLDRKDTEMPFHTTVKTRVVAAKQQIVRIDKEQELLMSDSSLRMFCLNVNEAMMECDAVVIADYSKGTVRQEVVDAVLGDAKKLGLPVGYDPKRNHALKLPGITLVTPNLREAYEAAGMEYRPLKGRPETFKEQLKPLANTLWKKWEPKYLMITLGEHGMFLDSIGDGLVEILPTKARDVFDVSGAGDTVIAACMLSLACGADFKQAARIANHAAGVVVGKSGTATCSQKELTESFEREQYERGMCILRKSGRTGNTRAPRNS